MGSVANNFLTLIGSRQPLPVLTTYCAVRNFLQHYRQDKNLLENYIDNLFVVPGQTTLMDAIGLAAEQVNAKARLDNVAFRDKVLFLATDGEDRGSKINEDQLIKILKKNGIKVYAIGLVKELDKEGGLIRKSPREKSKGFLEKITKETGGALCFQNQTRTILAIC